MHLQKQRLVTTNAEELEAFAARKVTELDEYDEALEKGEEDKALVDGGKMTKEEFIANTLNVSPSFTDHFQPCTTLRRWVRPLSIPPTTTLFPFLPIHPCSRYHNLFLKANRYSSITILLIRATKL
jgi:hypothetical protein